MIERSKELSYANVTLFELYSLKTLILQLTTLFGKVPRMSVTFDNPNLKLGNLVQFIKKWSRSKSLSILTNEIML